MASAPAEEEATVLMPAHSPEEVHKLLHLLGGGWAAEETVDLSDVQGVLDDVGFRWRPATTLEVEVDVKIEKEDRSHEDDEECYRRLEEDDDGDDDGWNGGWWGADGGFGYYDDFFKREVQHHPPRRRRNNRQQQGHSSASADSKVLLAHSVRQQAAVLMERAARDAADAAGEAGEGGDFLETSDAAYGSDDEDYEPQRKRKKCLGAVREPRVMPTEFECERCSEQFSDFDRYLSHAGNHITASVQSSEKPGWLACPEPDCGYSHPQRVGIEAHLRWSHSQVWCPYCGKSLSTKDREFRKHLTRKHPTLPRETCRVCSRPFLEVEDLNRHVQDDHDGRIVVPLERDPERPGVEKCPAGGCEFFHEDRSHICQHYAVEHGKVMCPHCVCFFGRNPHQLGRVFSLVLRRHFAKVHHETLHGCGLCYAVMASKEDRKTHMKEVHNSQDGHQKPVAICHLCGGEFQKSYLNSHESICTGKLKPRYIPKYARPDVFRPVPHPMIKDLPKEADPATGLFACSEEGCPVTVTTRPKLIRHLNQQHNPQECPHCKEKFSYFTIIEHVANEHHQQVASAGDSKSLGKTSRGKCDVCRRTVYVDMEVHRKKCKGPPNWKWVPNHNPKIELIKPDASGIVRCPEEGCDFSHPSLRGKVVKHFNIHHNKQTCPHCHKGYGFYHIREHIALEHTGETHVSCKHCGQGFFNRSLLREHVEAVHEVGRDFICDICGEAFPTRRKQVVHRSEKHTRRERKYPCPICGKVFRSSTLVPPHVAAEHAAAAAILQAGVGSR